MDRRSFISVLLGTPALIAIVAACGDDTKDAAGLVRPTGANDVVLRIGYEGGFVGPGVNFVRLPQLLISGDGRVVQPGAQTEQYPGPLLPTLTERTIDDAGIQKVLALASDAGLLAAPPDYSLPQGVGIADASDTVVEISANGTAYRHQANALGMDMGDGGKSTPARDRLNAFVLLLGDLPKVVGDAHLGKETMLAPDRYRFQAMVVDPTQFGEPAPTLVEWPSDTGVVLADSAQCATVEATKVADLFTRATQLTFFTEADVAYQLSVVAVLPGDAVC